MNKFDFSPLFRHSIGYDRLEEYLHSAVQRQNQGSAYPPYDIESVSEDFYQISIAVAGFAADDLEITQADNSLLIKGKRKTEENQKSYLHQGIATRSFDRRFDLAEHVKVVNANLDNGMLIIDLEREVPEALKPRQISINLGPSNDTGDKSKKLQYNQNKRAA